MDDTYIDVCRSQEKIIILHYIILFYKNVCNPLFSSKEEFPSPSNLHKVTLHGFFLENKTEYLRMLNTEFWLYRQSK
jgi:hypothetical protein